MNKDEKKSLNYIYSKTSVARTLMARLSRPFANSFLSPLEKSHNCRFGIILGDFLFYIENDILCVLI